MTMTTKKRKLDISKARRVRGMVKTGIRAGAQTVHLKMQIDGNDIVGESEASSTTTKS